MSDKYVTKVKCVDETGTSYVEQKVAAWAIVGDSPAQEYIDGKTQNLQTQINNLSNDLDAEEAARIAGDAALDDKLEAEIKRAKDSEALLVDLVAIERARAIKREDDIEDALDNEIWRAQDSEAYIISLIGSSVDDERIRAMAAEAALDDALKKEIKRATDSENRIDAKYAARVSVLQTEVADNTVLINNEIARAQNSEGILSNRIDNLSIIIDGKQDKLIAGSNILIASDGKTISAINGVKVDGVSVSNILTSPAHPYSTSNTLATMDDVSGLGTGTVTSVATSTGLIGGPITSSGTISIDTNVVQEKLIAGTNIIIASDGKTISAIDTIYDDTALSGRVTTIEGKEAAWDAKQDALPTVINNRYLHANATTGALEWSVIDSGGIKVDGVTTNNILTSTSHPYSTSNRLATIGDISAVGGGTVTEVKTGTGLSGGPITSSGTISVDTSVIQEKLTAGTGLAISGTTINHSNSVTAQTSGKLGTITYDAQGHVTGFVEKAVINNLTSTSTDQPLSAYQGKVLSDAIAASGNIKVVATKPGVAAAENNTMYYVGTSSPYNVYFYAKDSSGTMTEYDMGSTEVNLSEYRKALDQDTIDAGKQDKLTAGSNITISGTTISATDTTYTAGTNVLISSDNKISATDTTYTAGDHLSLTGGKFSVVSTPYTTLAPSADNTDGLKFVVLNSEPAKKYNGWIYFITD